MPAAPGLTTALRVRILYSQQGALLSVAVCLAAPLLAALAPALRMSRTSVVALLDRRRA
jgi:hypothetical protein